MRPVYRRRVPGGVWGTGSGIHRAGRAGASDDALRRQQAGGGKTGFSAGEGTGDRMYLAPDLQRVRHLR